MTLGDGADVSIVFTLRFRLLPEELRSIHERFGQVGIWSAIRDLSTSAVRSTLAAPGMGLDNLRVEGRGPVSDTLRQAVGEELRAAGFGLTLFSLGNSDLGASNEVVQATMRARLELEREDAEAPVRLARARHDAELQPFVTGDASSVALRYRENEVWRDLARFLAADRALVMSAPTRQAVAAAAESTRSETEDSPAEAEVTEE